MNRSTVSLMDLPDEILFTIWNKLNKLDVLYSFVDVNRRFNKLPLSMERILRAGKYPCLWKLTILKLDELSAPRFFTDNSPFAHLFKKQILHLTVVINHTE
ncbi:unnamed protein product [Rotaria magnacalcarata]|uniref:F-box domain-containing protein n=1 Tax=Rotaria magnacalcarata TaxID=392030 RepID=A0A8S2VKG4_9BILA|nr:unnamed protein product [Rotaria magnacalcarata]